MTIVIIERDEGKGSWKDPETDQEYDLVEVEDGVRLATLKPTVEADSAEAYASSQGWEEVEDF